MPYEDSSLPTQSSPAIIQSMAELEQRIHGIERHIRDLCFHSRHASGHIKGQLALWLPAILVEYHIQKRISARSIMSKQCCCLCGNFWDHGGPIEKNVNDSRTGIEQSRVSSLKITSWGSKATTSKRTKMRGFGQHSKIKIPRSLSPMMELCESTCISVGCID